VQNPTGHAILDGNDYYKVTYDDNLIVLVAPREREATTGNSGNEQRRRVADDFIVDNGSTNL
jgi:hypothetical protein